MKHLLLGWGLVAAVASGIAADTFRSSGQEMSRARQAFVTNAAAEARQNMIPLHQAMRTINEQLIALTTLPFLRARHDGRLPLSMAERLYLHEQFNGLAARAPVSALYVTTAGYRHDMTDPATGRRFEPALAITAVILNLNQLTEAAQARTIATAMADNDLPAAEGLVIAQHDHWFKATYPKRSRVNDQTVPLLADVIHGPTVEQSFLTDRPAEDDRLVFSSPYFAHDGTYAGMISLVVKEAALATLLPPGDYAVVSPGNGVFAGTLGENTLASSMEFVASARRDPARLYSEAIPLFLPDSRHVWFLWAGQPDTAFTNSVAARAVAAERRHALSTIAAVMAALLAFIWLIEKNLRQSKHLNASLAEARDIAEKSSAEAVEAADLFKSLNDDITRLNIELSDKVQALAEAQDRGTRHHQMTELGTIIAAAAEALRKPLTAVETTVRALRHTLAAADRAVVPELVQVDDGLSRCHVMLFQLQDYASTAAPKTAAVDVDQWLGGFLTGQAEGLPEALELNGNLDLDGRTAAMDVQQMGRALANVIRNAAEAMTGRDGRVMALMAGRKPRIHVTTAATARGIEIIVNDNGPGIAPEIIQRIREPLFTTKSFGAGLGLAATDRIMALHGGGMEIASVRGAGARITLWLPDAAARCQAA